jgi:L-lactate dehydrogenase
MTAMRQKIGVIGAGAVGSASLLSTVLRGVAREIVVVNRDPKRARGVVAEVQYGATLSSAVDIRAGDYPDLNGATLVMIAAGTNEKAGGATDRSDPTGRLRLLEANAGVYQQILPRLASTVPDVILVLTDPPDRWPTSFGPSDSHTS